MKKAPPVIDTTFASMTSAYCVQMASSMTRWSHEEWDVGLLDDSIVRKSDGLEFTVEYVPEGDFYWITTPGFPSFHVGSTSDMLTILQFIVTLYPYQQDPGWRYPVAAEYASLVADTEPTAEGVTA